MAPALATLAILGLALPVSAGKPLPFRATADEVVTDVTLLGPDLVQFTVDATGEATYLGEFTSTATIVLDLANGTATETRVLIAANGDQLYAEGEFAFTSATTVEGTITITGGTGRFQNASGEVEVEGVTPDGIHFAVTGEGTIEF
jgi:hypothetical protein